MIVLDITFAVFLGCMLYICYVLVNSKPAYIITGHTVICILLIVYSTGHILISVYPYLLKKCLFLNCFKFSLLAFFATNRTVLLFSWDLNVFQVHGVFRP